MELRSCLVWLAALAAARFVNWAIYNWCWTQYSLGPWAPAPVAPGKSGGRAKASKNSVAARRSWADHIPVIGWYRLRREAQQHGRGYWIRPLLIEIFFPTGIAWYYAVYVSGAMLPIRMQPPAAELSELLHWQFLGHFVLLTLMTIASFIDFDEFSIPDYVTVPGTLIGLLGAACAPAWLPFHAAALGLEELHANIPAGWPLWLNGGYGLGLGLLVVVVWGGALLERRWITRRGFGKAIQYFLARLFRHRWHWLTVAAFTALLALGVLWSWSASSPRWPFLLSSLFGLAFAGGVTWAVRISASAGLGVEALGFGDVTLMAMIGTYIGWQPSLLVFFIAPLVAIAFVLLRALVTGETATPYGPYLCAATVLVLVYWNAIWNLWAAPMFSLGWLILGIVVACVVLMGAMLWIWRLIKQATLKVIAGRKQAGT